MWRCERSGIPSESSPDFLRRFVHSLGWPYHHVPDLDLDLDLDDLHEGVALVSDPDRLE